MPKRPADPRRNYRGSVTAAAAVQDRLRGRRRARARHGYRNRSEKHDALGDDALGDGQWERAKLRLPSEEIVPEHGVMNDCEIAHEPPDIGRGKPVMRYVRKPDFGMPQSAFPLCRFCLTDVWWKLYRRNGASEMFNDLLQYRKHFGLRAADAHLKRSEECEDLRQTCPMAGLIPTAVRSQSREDRYWLD